MPDSKFKPGYCENCVHEKAPEPFVKPPCKGCLGTWGTELEKPNFVPKPEFVLDEGEIPKCTMCKHMYRSKEHLECKYCTAMFGASTGNYFEPKDEYVAPTAEPVTVEDKDVARTITNAMQLMRARELREGDVVMFGDIKYTVVYNHLYNDAYDNEKVFTALDIDNEGKYKLADLAYGYDTGRLGSWPEYEANDYAAATRLCFMLYALLDAKQAEDYEEKVVHLQELKAQLESYQQDEDDAAVELAKAQRNYDYEKQAREQLEADIELLEKELSK